MDDSDFGWASCNCKGGRRRQKRENQIDGSTRRTWPNLVGFEDGGRKGSVMSQGMRWPLEVGKARKQTLP